MFRHKLIATACGMGYSPIAPGTVGAMFGVLLWLPLFVWTNAAVCSCVTLAAIIACFWLGVRSTDALTPQWGKDPSRVVIDEVIGVWVCLLAVPHAPLAEAWGWVVAAFVLFRLFDIVKPFNIRSMESIKGGIGVMADDLLAGAYGALVLLFVQCLG